jgi:hypothetical protein
MGSQPLLQGSQEIAGAIRNVGGTERSIGRIAGSFVPSILSDIAEAIDPQQRETKGEGILAPTQRRIPFLRENLPPAIDALGQPLQDYGPVQGLFDPTRATTAVEKQNPLFAELVRLDAGISGFRQKHGETAENYRSRVQRGFPQGKTG